jgi:hypothetical protein
MQKLQKSRQDSRSMAIIVIRQLLINSTGGCAAQEAGVFHWNNLEDVNLSKIKFGTYLICLNFMFSLS